MPATLPILITLLLQIPSPSQPPFPSPIKSAKEEKSKTSPKQTKPDSNQAPTNNPSPPLDTSVSNAARESPKNTAEDGTQKSTTDWWPILNSALITLFTGALAYLAHQQFRAMHRQAEYMKAGLDITQQAANAATLAAETAKRSLELTERAELSLVSVKEDPFGMPFSKYTRFEIKFRNFGRTKAIGCTIDGRIRVSRNEGLEIIEEGVDIAPGAVHTIETKRMGDWNWEDGRDTVAEIEGFGAAQLSLSIEATFSDIFGKSHELKAEAECSDRKWRVYNGNPYA